MAEAIGLGASVLAIVGIAGTALKLSNSLYRTARTIGSAKEEIEILASNIAAFANIVQLTHDFLQEHCRTQPQSKVLGYIKQHGVLTSLVTHSGLIENHIKKLRPQISSLRSTFDLITRLKWTFVKSEVQSLDPEMESVKNNFLLIIQILTLDGLQRGQHSKKADRQVKQLKRMIKVLVKTMIKLKERQSRSHSLFLSISTHSTASVDQESIDAIIDLAESMVNNGTVPVPNASTSAPEEFQQRPRALDHDSFTNVRRRHSNRVPPARHQESAPDQLQNLASHPIAQPHTLQRSSSEGLPTSRRPRTFAARGLNNGGDYVSVRPSNYLLDLDISNSHEGVEGYIETPNGLVHATANLDPTFGDNLIAAGYAATLGLEIQPFDDEYDGDQQWVMFKNGQRVRKLGKVTLKWGKGRSSHLPTFPVHCWVYEHNIRNLVFGQPFIDKRNHYWEGRKSSSRTEEAHLRDFQSHNSVQIETESQSLERRSPRTNVIADGSPSSSRQSGRSHQLRGSSRRIDPGGSGEIDAI